MLGSGISSNAGILTGWGITMDLVRKLARASHEDPGPDPASWFETKYNQKPDYSDILERLAPTQAERHLLLRSYFVPSDDEKEEGLKVPTKAHKAIAQLVASRHIRVILTTNFDSLLEQALAAEGVQPAIVSDVSAIKGMLPLQHQDVTVIKLHGSFLDTRLRNTLEELESYDPELNALLDRIFDEYGLLICGWSGIWDAALRDALYRCKSHRFTTFWAGIAPLESQAKNLLSHRRGQFVPIQGADTFFESLQEQVQSLDELAAESPLTIAAAVTTAKRYLAKDEFRIRLDDFYRSETEQVRNISLDILTRATKNDSGFSPSVLQIDKSIEKLLGMCVVGGYWGTSLHFSLWCHIIERLGNHESAEGATTFLELRRYPSLLTFYCFGIAALIKGKEQEVVDLFLLPKLRLQTVSGIVNPLIAFDFYCHRQFRLMFPDAQPKTPVSDHIHRVIRPIFANLVPDNDDFDTAFDRFEFFRSLAWYGVEGYKSGHIHCGRYYWREARGAGNQAVRQITEEINSQKDDWILIKAGIYAGKADILAKALKAHAEAIERAAFY